MTETELRQIIREELTVKELLTMQDVAAMLSLSTPSVRKLRDSGALPFYVVAGKKLFRRADVMNFINQLKPEGRNESWKAERNAAAI
ncbi:helix-turn-helix domain-containing protein [uncultured Mitsuokella sp.]|uniref:helix-turn-helix domain-containing protein n=1 Tax=uncultured Mitsuokella sp. TaxID=453120 RepID=UPI0025F54242|nr:helix-turn-helix domain-containing protein [uncultured Mitsuokella sp.]